MLPRSSHALVPLLFFGCHAFAQIPIDTQAARKIQESLAAAAVQLEGCDFSKVEPSLDYSLKFESGYETKIPLGQLPGKGHRLSAWIHLVPHETGSQPSDFLRQYDLPAVPPTTADAQIAGTFPVAQGVSTVTAWIFDETLRSCRAEWEVKLKSSREERIAALQLPTTPLLDRLTVLLHAAPVVPGPGTPPESDITIMMESLFSLLEFIPARHIRLVIFSLTGQKELFRKDDFAAVDISRASSAIGQIGPAPVDVRTLANAKAHLDMLAALMNRELVDADPPGAMIFLGPPGISNDRIGSKALRTPPLTPPMFYIEFAGRPAYVQSSATEYMASAPGRKGVGSLDARVENTSENSQPVARIGPAGSQQNSGAQVEFNTIRFMVSSLKGKTFVVWRPLDFAQALRKIAASVKSSKR